MDNLNLHLERLRRHYEHSLHTYDEVSLCDLSNILRIWTELASELIKNKKYRSLKKFQSASHNKRLVRMLKGNDYLLLDLPPLTTTYASTWEIFKGPRGTETATGGVKSRLNTSNNSMDFRAMYAYYSHKFNETPKLMSRNKVKKHNILEWMGCEVVRYRYTNEDHSIIEDKIPRNVLIRRVANTMNGSHPSKVGETNSKNKYNKHMDHLMKYQLGDLPLPYFVLLNTAQQILNIFDRTESAP